MAVRDRVRLCHSSNMLNPHIARSMFTLCATALVTSLAFGQICIQEIVPPTSLPSGFLPGFSTALSSNWALLGDLDSASPGAVTVYRRDPVTGILHDPESLTPSDGIAGDLFGLDCDVDGTTIVVGASSHVSAGASTVGAVYVFEHVQGSWVESQILSSPGVSNGFGSSVALDDDWLAIASPAENLVFLFQRQAQGWTMTGSVELSFGTFPGIRGLAIKGDLLAVAGSDEVGIFERSPAGTTWIQTQSLPVSGQEGGVDVDVTGAVFVDASGVNFLERDPMTGSWGAATSIISSSTRSGVAIAGSRIALVSAQSSFETYLRSGTGWSLEASLLTGIHFFTALDADDDVFLIGSTADLLIDVDCGSLGQPSCLQGELNSAGFSAGLVANGSRFVADNDLTLVATWMPTQTVGVFLASLSGTPVMTPAGATGRLCVGPSFGIFDGPSEVQYTATTGSFALTVDLTTLPLATGTVAAIPGETWYFQAWYRDVDSGPTSRFTTTTAVEFQ